MLRLVDNERWLEATASTIEQVRAGERLALRAGTTVRERLVANLANALPSSLLVHVPASPDQSERVLLGLGAALGREVVASVDACLRRDAERVDDALAILDQARGGRILIVDGWDRLGDIGDRELSYALGDRAQAVRQWLADHAGLTVVDHGDTPAEARVVPAPDGQPAVLVNGEIQNVVHWERFAPNAEAFLLALTQVALGGEPELTGGGRDGQRERIFERLPDALGQLLVKLALHGRPLDPIRLGPRADQLVALGADLGLFHRTPGGVTTAASWSAWCRSWLGTRASDVHRELAEMFAASARPADPHAGQAGLDLLEAHRHFILAGERERAMTFARYGAQLLVQAARSLSVQGRYREAASAYAPVVDGAPIPIGPKLRGYARHYLHFNRARAQLEPMVETEQGYRRALVDWPTNALFHSRFIRTLFYQRRTGAALEALAIARHQVPPHPDKDLQLVVRTVRGLLRNEDVHDAVVVWGAYEAEGIYARNVFNDLREAMANGWSTTSLTLSPDEPLVFNEARRVRITEAGVEWIAELVELTQLARGNSPVAALASLVRTVRETTSRLVRAYTPSLPLHERLTKRILLGTIDVPASRVDAAHPDSYWVLGILERDAEGKLWLRTQGVADDWFEVPESVVVRPADDLPHFARVAVDERGSPRGPVIQLEDGFRGDESELWERWKRRLADEG